MQPNLDDTEIFVCKKRTRETDSILRHLKESVVMAVPLGEEEDP